MVIVGVRTMFPDRGDLVLWGLAVTRIVAYAAGEGDAFEPPRFLARFRIASHPA